MASDSSIAPPTKATSSSSSNLLKSTSTPHTQKEKVNADIRTIFSETLRTIKRNRHPKSYNKSTSVDQNSQTSDENDEPLVNEEDFNSIFGPPKTEEEENEEMDRVFEKIVELVDEEFKQKMLLK